MFFDVCYLFILQNPLSGSNYLATMEKVTSEIIQASCVQWRK